MRAMLELDGVTKSFGRGEAVVTALDEVDLSVAEGELVLVTGPSGSGKTTLLQVAGALMRPSSGRVLIAGEDLHGLPERSLAHLRAARIGFVFQAFNLFANLSAEGNVSIQRSMVKRDARLGPDRGVALLNDLGLGERLKHRPAELSGGEQQRVALARALINNPPILLADEPTGNLDSRSGFEVIHRLEGLVRQQGKTILMVTHDFRFAKIADRVLWLEDGRFVAAPSQAEEVIDPVCGMAIRPDAAAATRELREETVYFCSEICVRQFDLDPDRFLQEKSESVGSEFSDLTRGGD